MSRSVFSVSTLMPKLEPELFPLPDMQKSKQTAAKPSSTKTRAYFLVSRVQLPKPWLTMTVGSLPVFSGFKMNPRSLHPWLSISKAVLLMAAVLNIGPVSFQPFLNREIRRDLREATLPKPLCLQPLLSSGGAGIEA